MDCSGEEKAPSRPLSRGELLKRAGILGAAAAVPVAVAPESALAQEELTQLQKLKALSPGEAATISAFCERLIPSDSTGPGARECNVIRYIDRALAGDLAMFRSSYTAAAVALDAYSQSKFGGAFATLSPANQDAVLTDMDDRTAQKGGAQTNRLLAQRQSRVRDDSHARATGHVRRPGSRLEHELRRVEARSLPRASARHQRSRPAARRRPEVEPEVDVLAAAVPRRRIEEGLRCQR